MIYRKKLFATYFNYVTLFFKIMKLTKVYDKIIVVKYDMDRIYCQGDTKDFKYSIIKYYQ